MADKLINGDYVKENNTLIKIEYIDELLQNAGLVLNAERGRFYPNKNFGSRIKEAAGRPAEYALAYARQALDGIDGVFVCSASQSGNSVVLKLMINGEEREVSIALENNI